MNAILKCLRKLPNDDLLSISEAIDLELENRLERIDPIPESARRRAIERGQSYRRRTGAAAPPIKMAGLGRGRNTRPAA